MQSGDTTSYETIPALLGPPNLSGLKAFSHADMLPFATEAESDELGSAIYTGRLAEDDLEQNGRDMPTEQRLELLSTIETGRQARTVMAAKHLALVIGVSRKFAYDRDRKISEDARLEMIGVGNLALVACMDRYTHIPGKHFAGYAKRCVTNAMIAEVMKNIRSQTGLSHRMQLSLLEIDRAFDKARLDNPAVSFEEIAERLGYDAKRVKKILAQRRVQEDSLDKELGTENGATTLADRIGDPTSIKALNNVEDQLLVQQVFKTIRELRRRQIISDDEWHVFVARFIDGKTQDQIAKEWPSYKTQGGIVSIEQRVTEKIKHEIEYPGYHEKKFQPDLTIVESAVDLLGVLNIPIDGQTDILGIARNILDNLSLTQWQREVMHALLGTAGKHYRPKELAKERQRSHRAIYDAREKAMRRIMASWLSMTVEERQEAALKAPSEPTVAKSSGPRPNVTGRYTRQMNQQDGITWTKEKILECLLAQNAPHRPNKKWINELANQGLSASTSQIESAFGDWPAFSALYAQLAR